MSADAGSSGATPAADPEADPDEAPSSAGDTRLRWKANALLFLATIVSTLLTGAYADSDHYPLPALWPPPKLLHALPEMALALPRGLSFAVPLLAILLTHELGHYVAARIHRVDASLPYFIPLPFLSPFGTMGAVINMRGRIRSRNALLDIGASGPLAGLCVAIPVLVAGLMESEVLVSKANDWQEGQCLLYLILKRVVLGPIPAGYDVFLSPMAFAGWVGLFVTMLNLVTVAQLDGGHIAYALFGPRQNRYARVLHPLLLVFFAFNVVRFVGPVLLRRDWSHLGHAIGNSTFWLVWYLIIHVIMRVGGRDHPPTEPGPLSPVRKVLAVLSLVLFALLFMPAPFTEN